MSDGSDGNTGKRSGRDTSGLKRWEKGQSGNPGGRPAGTKGLAARIRERTGDGRLILDLLLDTLTGEIKSSTKEKTDAARILLERGWGKAPELIVSVNANASEVTSELADEHLETLVRLLHTPPSARPALPTLDAVCQEAIPAEVTPDPPTEQAPGAVGKERANEGSEE